MKNYFLSLLLSAIVAIPPTGSAQPTIYIVRHAEKLPAWLGDELDDFHPLSDMGISRAHRLSEQFEKGSLSAIFSSSTTRTLHTALPLALKLGIPIQISAACYDTTAIDGFYTELKKNFGANQAVLLVTHSNIIPYLLMRAGLAPACRSEMGIVIAPDGSGWLVIEGYDNIWKLGGLDERRKDCTNFNRRKY